MFYSPVFLMFILPVLCSTQDKDAPVRFSPVVELRHLANDVDIEAPPSRVNSLFENVQNDTANSFNTLEKYAEWAAKEEDIIQVLSERMKLLTTEDLLIQNYLDDYNETTGEAMRHLKSPKETPAERGKVVGSSAVLGHRMTKRYASMVHQLRQFLMSTDYLDNQDKMASALKLGERWQQPGEWLGSHDLYMSMATFFHLDEVYNISPKLLAAGVHVNDTSSGQLSALHSAEIGIFALYLSKQSIAIEWLELAKIRVEEELPDETMEPDLVFGLHTVSIQQHNRDWHKAENITRNADETPLHSFYNFYTHPVTKRQSPQRRKPSGSNGASPVITSIYQ